LDFRVFEVVPEICSIISFLYSRVYATTPDFPFTSHTRARFLCEEFLSGSVQLKYLVSSICSSNKALNAELFLCNSIHGKKENYSGEETRTLMDLPPDYKSRNFSSAICYRISNIMDRAMMEEICSRKGVSVLYADDISELLEGTAGSLVILDLANLKEEDLESLVKSAKIRNWRILGYYPHVSREIGERALSGGLDYVVPRSAFKRKLEQILTS
jgi:hypothetical protein